MKRLIMRYKIIAGSITNLQNEFEAVSDIYTF